MFGCDATQGIVSVDADNAGRARVWQRTGVRVEASEHRFPNWFLTTSLDLLAHLPAQRLSAEWLRTRHGRVTIAEQLSVVELEPPVVQAEDAYRYLVLTSHLDEVETALVEMANKRDGGEAQTLADLRGLVLICHPIEQFLTLTGQTYFKGMRFDDLHRLQFDLETTGLNEDRDRIFMVSLRDSRGWKDCLDTRELSEAAKEQHGDRGDRRQRPRTERRRPATEPAGHEGRKRIGEQIAAGRPEEPRKTRRAEWREDRRTARAVLALARGWARGDRHPACGPPLRRGRPRPAPTRAEGRGALLRLRQDRP